HRDLRRLIRRQRQLCMRDIGYGNTSASRYFPALRTLNRLIAQHRRA
ncbi:hypothetical protein, partial [Klebsiella pneumoniae]